MYDHSDNHMRFRVNNTERLRIDSSGSVGIGTSSPARGLHVNNNGESFIRITSSDTGNAGIEFGDQSDGVQGAIFQNSTDNSLRFNGYNNSEAMRITSSGSVGIGTSNPQADGLDVANNAGTAGGATEVMITGNASGKSVLALGDGSNRYVQHIISDHTNNSLQFNTAASSLGANEAMRIDSSGNLLVGKTSNDNGATRGIEIEATGQLNVCNEDALVSRFNRLTSDGDIVTFRKDGSTVGSIGTQGGDKLTIGNGDVGVAFNPNADSVYPWNTATNAARDAGVDLGYSDGGSTNIRFRNLYLSGGVYLGGTGSANKLDDYEEGTWTPSGNSGITINSVQHGTYTKVGQSVFATAWIKVNPTSANIQIGGLPFSESGRATASISNATQAQVITNQIAGTTFYAYGVTTAGTNDDMFISISYHTTA